MELSKEFYQDFVPDTFIRLGWAENVGDLLSVSDWFLGMWRVWVRRGGCVGSWWGNRRERDHWGDLGVDGWIILGWICGEREVYRVLVGKPEGRRPLGRPRRRWVDNIRMDL